jgi:hypothetical protein
LRFVVDTAQLRVGLPAFSLCLQDQHGALERREALGDALEASGNRHN